MDDLGRLFQPGWFYESMILWFYDLRHQQNVGDSKFTIWTLLFKRLFLILVSDGTENYSQLYTLVHIHDGMFIEIFILGKFVFLKHTFRSLSARCSEIFILKPVWIVIQAAYASISCLKSHFINLCRYILNIYIYAIHAG